MDCVSDLVITNNLFAQPGRRRLTLGFAITGESYSCCLKQRPSELRQFAQSASPVRRPTFVSGTAYIGHKREVVPLAAAGSATVRKSPFEVAPGTAVATRTFAIKPFS